MIYYVDKEMEMGAGYVTTVRQAKSELKRQR